MSCCGFALFCAIAIPASAAAAPFPPGLEHDVQALTDGSLPGGCEVNEIRIDSFAIDLTVTCGADSGELRLVDRDDADSSELRRTASFAVLVPDASPKVRAAEAKLIDRISARDDGAIHRKLEAFATQTKGTRSSWSFARRLGFADDIRRAATWFALLVLLLGLIASHVARLSVRGVLPLLLLSAFALALRVEYGSWAPLHANNHGISELRGLASGPADWQGPVETDKYGVAYRQFVRAVIGPWKDSVTSALAVSAVASAMSVVALAVLVFFLFGSAECAAVAAVGLAIHPVHLTLSGSESPMPLADALFLIGTASLCAVPSIETARMRAAAYWAGGLALACSGELAVTTLAFPVAGLLIASVHSRSRLRADWKLWSPPLIVLAGTTAIHVWALGPIFAEASARSGELSRNVSIIGARRSALFDSSFCSPLLMPLALAGASCLLLRRSAGGIALIVAAVGIVVISMTVNGCRTDAIRYQGCAHALVFALAASVIRLAPRRFQWGAALLACAALMPMKPAWTALHRPPLDVIAYRMLNQPLPDRAEVHIAPRRMADGRVLNDFPEYAVGHNVSVHEGTPGEVNDRCRVWIGPSCWWSGPEPAGENGIRPECERLIAAADMTSAVEVPVPYRETEFHAMPERVRIGLFPCATSAHHQQ